MSLAIDVDDLSGIETLGKSASALQSGIEIGENVITGTVKYVTGYTGFSGDTEEQSGYYIALHADVDADDAAITLELIGGTHGPKTLDSDGLMVCRLIDPQNQAIRLTATKSGKSVSRTWSLRGLTLA